MHQQEDANFAVACLGVKRAFSCEVSFFVSSSRRNITSIGWPVWVLCKRAFGAPGVLGPFLLAAFITAPHNKHRAGSSTGGRRSPLGYFACNTRSKSDSPALDLLQMLAYLLIQLCERCGKLDQAGSIDQADSEMAEIRKRSATPEEKHVIRADCTHAVRYKLRYLASLSPQKPYTVCTPDMLPMKGQIV